MVFVAYEQAVITNHWKRLLERFSWVVWIQNVSDKNVNLSCMENQTR